MKRILCALTWVMLTAGLGAAEASAKFGALAAGAVVPDFTVVGADKKDMKLADLRGRAVVVGFWTTNRGPAEGLQTAFLQYQELGMTVLGVCVGGMREELEAGLGANGAKYPDLVCANDPKGREVAPELYAERASAKLYRVRGIPTQFVIGRDGKIADVLVGFGGAGDHRLEEALPQLGVTVKESK
jgi:peroxiredoxin